MYKCLDCGNEMELEDLKFEKDRDTLEMYMYCPYCGSENVEQAYQCDVCGEYLPEEQMAGDAKNVCICCISEKRHDVDFCKAVGDEDQESVYLNSFLLDMFTEEDIEEILMRELKAHHMDHPVDFMPYLRGHLDSAANVLETY